LTQGTIVSVDAASNTMTVTLDPGYAGLDAPIFSAGPRYTPRVSVLSPGRTTFSWMASYGVKSVTKSGANWQIGFDKPLPSQAASNVGKRFFVWGNQGSAWNPIVWISGVKNLTVANINDYAGGGFAGGDGSTGTITFDHVYCGPPPGTDRLGFYSGHQGHTRATVVMSHCAWVMSNDDDVNELNPLDYIREHPAPNVLIVRKSDDYQVGDRVSIWDWSDPQAIHVRATATVKSVRVTTSGLTQLELDRDVAVGKTGTGAGERGGEDRQLDGIDRLTDLTSGGAWKLYDSTFNAAFAHPLLIKTATGIDIERCHIYGSDMTGLESGMISYWNEGSQSCNIVLKNNVFYDNDGIGACLGIGAKHGNSTASHDQENIVVEGNLFVSGGSRPVWNYLMAPGLALRVSNGKHVSIKDNVFIDVPDTNISVYSSDDISIAGNVFLLAHNRKIDAGGHENDPGIDIGADIAIANSQNVRIGGNVDYLEGPFGTKTIAVGSSVTDIYGAGNGVATGKALLCDLDRRASSTTARVTAPTAGTYRLVILYANGATRGAPAFTVPATVLAVSVNGRQARPVAFEWNGVDSPDTPDLAAIVPITLKAGSNAIVIEGVGKNTRVDKAIVLL